MKFKRLYLNGFKSFVDKTSLDFPDGITAVVGPNGSGKSNIMDAVRWVFGEQSAKELRGTDMDDVVFNGSAKRKPAGFAEVALTLSEIDDAVASKYGTFSDITITRKFYRSGEREYFINNRKCRLKDIKDIFMDTGLGARSISIIEQGKVDKIINSTPEELRFFLEETAGVTKFKDKKKDAEKRLLQTRENLDRLNDIIKEVFESIEKLSSQVEKLKISEEKQDKKRSLEKQFLAVTFSMKKNEAAKYETTVAENKIELTERIKLHTELISNHATLEGEYMRMEQLYKACNENKVYTSNELVRARAEINNLNNQLTNADGQKKTLQEDIAREEKRSLEITALREEKILNSSEAETITSKIGEQLREMNEIIADLKRAKEQVDEDFAVADKLYLGQAKMISDMHSERAKREITLANNKDTAERLIDNKNEIDKNIAQIITSIDNLDLSISTTSLELRNQESKLAEEKTLHSKIKEDADFYRNKQSELQGKLSGLKSNLTFLEDQISSYTLGSTDDSKPLKAFKTRLLIDMLKKYPKDKLLDLSDILVFDDADKAAVLEAVKTIKSSIRFTFLLNVTDISAMLEHNNIDSISSSVVVINGIYKKLGEDDKAVKIMRIKERIAHDNEQIALIDEELLQSNKELESVLLKLDAKNREIEQHDERLRRTRDIYTKSVTELDNHKIDKDRQSTRLISIAKEIEIAQNSVDNVEREISEFTVKLERLAKTQLQSEEDRNILEEKKEFMARDLDGKRDETNELKIELNRREEQSNSLKRELASINKQIDDVMLHITNFKSRYQTLINIDEATWRQQLADLSESVKQLEINSLTADEDLKKSEITRNHIKEQMDLSKKETDEKMNLIRESESTISQINNSLASTRTSVENIFEQYLEKFGNDINDEYKNYLVDDFDHSKIKDEISQLNREIDLLGAINLNAVQDFTEADERYKFLVKQRDDLESSIADINTFISETDGTTAELFEATFNSVRDKFLDVFHILFGNGEAELRLTDPDNILISGVEIYIQPPGKKLQHMGLLSGGEKALTAMTLLFALFLQKPTPFCFLDEVDAPLDDANVERYTNMVKTLSDKTQFILITHNHNTMAMADSLYGVKMQESGVSSILSVKLDHIDVIGR